MGQQMYYRITKRVGQEKTIIVFSCFYFQPLIPEGIHPKPCRAMTFGQPVSALTPFCRAKESIKTLLFPLSLRKLTSIRK